MSSTCTKMKTMQLPHTYTNVDTPASSLAAVWGIPSEMCGLTAGMGGHVPLWQPPTSDPAQLPPEPQPRLRQWAATAWVLGQPRAAQLPICFSPLWKLLLFRKFGSRLLLPRSNIPRDLMQTLTKSAEKDSQTPNHHRSGTYREVRRLFKTMHNFPS